MNRLDKFSDCATPRFLPRVGPTPDRRYKFVSDRTDNLADVREHPLSRLVERAERHLKAWIDGAHLPPDHRQKVYDAAVRATKQVALLLVQGADRSKVKMSEPLRRGVDFCLAHVTAKLQATVVAGTAPRDEFEIVPKEEAGIGSIATLSKLVAREEEVPENELGDEVVRARLSAQMRDIAKRRAQRHNNGVEVHA